MGNCRNCSEPVDGNFCSNCGEPAVLEKIDKRYFVNELKGVVGVQSGFWQSIKKLLFSPGESARHYIEDDRNKFVKPVMFLIFTSLLYTIVNNLFGSQAEEFAETGFDATLNYVMNWVFIENYGYTNLVLCFLTAFFIKGFFKKYNRNIYECFVLLCFLGGVVNVISSIPIVLGGFLPEAAAGVLEGVILLFALIYYIAGIASFFDRKKAGNYIKAFFATLIPILILMIVLIAVVFVLGIAVFGAEGLFEEGIYEESMYGD